MKICQVRWDACLLKGLTVLMLSSGSWALSSCKEDDGLNAGDPNYFTSSRGQFTATLDDGTTLFLIPGDAAGTATVTFDGSNPRHLAGVNNVSVSVTTYQGDLTIPSNVTGSDGKSYTITGIGAEAFMGCRNLTTLTLPSTIEWIGDGAFCICTTLTTINIPEGVTSLPSTCFGECSLLSSVSLPSTLKLIGRMAFFKCKALPTDGFTLPEGLEYIGELSFGECYGDKFRTITIPASVKTIADRAFGGREGSRLKINTYYMKSATPPTLEGVLYDVNADLSTPVTIHVPVGSKAAYEAANGWSSLTIEEDASL